MTIFLKLRALNGQIMEDMAIKREIDLQILKHFM